MMLLVRLLNHLSAEDPARLLVDQHGLNVLAQQVEVFVLRSCRPSLGDSDGPVHR